MSENPAEGWIWMIDTSPGWRSDRAFSATRARHAAPAEQWYIRTDIAAASPRAWAVTSAVMADRSAPSMLNTRASTALTARNSTTPAMISSSSTGRRTAAS